MFRRKNKTLQDSFRDAIWPKMGWTRVFRYYGLRIYRLKDPPYAVAAGLASGVAMSFTPFVGLHFILSLGMAWMLNGSMIAAMLGTAFGNPWTFPIIWYVTYKLGMLVLGSSAAHELPVHFSVQSIFTEPQIFFIPMLIGAIPCAVIAWLVTFFFLRNFIHRIQRRRQKRRARARLREIQRRRDMYEKLKERENAARLSGNDDKDANL